MKGVQFLVDDQGKKKSVLIDLRVHGRMWEDFYDALVAKQREDEPRELFDEVMRRVLGEDA